MAAYFIIDPIKAETYEKSELDKKKLELKIELVSEFLSKSYKYTAVAYDALLRDSSAIILYENDVNDDFNEVQNRVEVFFGDRRVTQMMVQIDTLQMQLHEAYQRNASKNDWEDIRNKLKQRNNEVAAEILKRLKFL